MKDLEMLVEVISSAFRAHNPELFKEEEEDPKEDFFEALLDKEEPSDEQQVWDDYYSGIGDPSKC